MSRNTVAELGYVGLVGRRLLGETDIHQPSLAARQASPGNNALAIVSYTGPNRFAARVPHFMSNYNALQASLDHRTVHGLTLEIAYTWSKNMTNESNNRGTAIYDIYDPAKDDGPSSFKQPQVFLADYVYELPFFRTQHGPATRARFNWAANVISDQVPPTRHDRGGQLRLTMVERDARPGKTLNRNGNEESNNGR